MVHVLDGSSEYDAHLLIENSNSAIHLFNNVGIALK